MDAMLLAYFALVPHAAFAVAAPRALAASGVVGRLLGTKVRSLPADLLRWLFHRFAVLLSDGFRSFLYKTPTQ